MQRFVRIDAAAWIAIAFVVAGLGCNRDASPSPAPLEASPVSTNTAVRLQRAAHPLAQPRFDVGLLDPDRRLENLALVFQPSAKQIADRDALLAAQLDRRSPSYRQWLTPEQYAARFGADAATVERSRAWLAAQGLEVHATSRLGTRVGFAGRVADLQSAFKTEFHRYSLGGVEHYAMASAPAIPPDLSRAILGIHNTHDFVRPRPAIRPRVEPEAVCPAGDLRCQPRSFGLAPRDWATIYDVNPLYASGVNGAPLDGSGVTIAVVGEAAIAPRDVDAFRAAYGLPPARLTTIVVPGTGVPAPGIAPDSVSLEAMADVEWAGGIAPGAQIDFVLTGQDDSNLFDAVFYAIEQDLAPILSESFSICELGLTPADADALGLFGAAANVMGITYVAATGDTGAAGCNVSPIDFPGLYASEPATLPGVTAVGGTEFANGAVPVDCSGSAAGYAPGEIGWNEDTTQGGPMSGGGGASVVFPRPAYQAGIPTCSPVGSLPSGTNAAAMRQVPDVSFNSGVFNTPYFIQCTIRPDSAGRASCDPAGGSPSVMSVGGTSLGTPAFAGLLALANQAMGTRLGNVNPELYALSGRVPAAFHDITVGSNLVPCSPGTEADAGCPATACPDPAGGSFCYGYRAAAGYDCATGLGSIDAANLLRAWAALPSTNIAVTASTATIAAGSPVTLSATVTASDGAPLAGTVTFTTQSAGPIFFEDRGFYDPVFFTSDGGIAGAFQARVLGSASLAGGAATLSARLPVGMMRPGGQTVDVVASYDGDGQHAASASPPLRLTFSGADLCIAGATRAVKPMGAVSFAASSSAGPVFWTTAADSTCDEKLDCSTISAAGDFVAGPGAGYVVVVAEDTVGAVALAFVTVGTPSQSPPWGTQTPSQCPAADAGADDGGAADADIADGGGAADADIADGDTPDGSESGVADGGAIQDGAVDGGYDATAPIAMSDGGRAPFVEAGFTGYAPLPCDGSDYLPPDATVVSGDTPPVRSGRCGCVAAGRSRETSGVLGLVLLAGAITARRRRA